MSDLNLKTFDKLYPMIIHKYDELFDDQNANIMDRINTIVNYLNQVGKLTNDVVKDWNVVYQWVMNDGLTTDVNNKIEAMRANGELDQVLQSVFNSIAGDKTTLHTTAKDTLVNAINEVDDLAKSNQTKMGDLTTLTTADKDTIVHAINDNVASLAQIVTLAPKPNGTDDTTSLQVILNKGGHIRIPDGTYLINVVNTSGNNDKPNGGLSIPSNTTLELSPNAVLQAITNNSQTYSIIRVQDASNVIIRGGTIKGERSTHTGTGGEWGYGICLNGATNVSIEDVTVQDCWGDGIFINASVTTDAVPCKNIKLKGVVSDNNRRQGMSTQHVDGLNAYSCRFSNTNGTSPQCGVDLEPIGGSGYYTKNVRFIGCEFIGNSGDGMQTNSNVSQLVVEASTFIANSNRGISVYNMVGGTVSNNIFQGHTSGAGVELQACSDISVVGNKSIGNKNGINVLTGSIKNTIIGNTCNANTQNGIASIGATDNNISGNVCEGNTQEGIYMYSSNNNNVGNNVSESNSIGIHLSSTSNNNQITNNYCRKNNGEGIKLDSSHHNSIQNNTCLENSQTTNVANDNILLFQCNYSNIQGNTCRKGATTNLPRYGIFVQDTSSTGNLLIQNDCYTGGATGGIANTGTSTLFGAGNRNNDGTFTTTPN